MNTDVIDYRHLPEWQRAVIAAQTLPTGRFAPSCDDDQTGVVLNAITNWEGAR